MRKIVERRIWTIPVEGSLSYNQIYNRVVQDFPKADDGMVLWVYDDGFEIKGYSIPNLLSFVKDLHQFQMSSHLGDLRIAHLISPGMRMEVHAARLFTLIEIRNYLNATPGWTRGVFRDGQAALEWLVDSRNYPRIFLPEDETIMARTRILHQVSKSKVGHFLRN